MKNVLELLERTAARLPRQTAFADQQCSYDYQTVVNVAESVGSALAANGDRNCPVAVLMERGAPCLVTLMGVLYSGNFYVVLDPEMPAERVNKILHTLQPTALICDEAHKDDPAQPGVQPDETPSGGTHIAINHNAGDTVSNFNKSTKVSQ